MAAFIVLIGLSSRTNAGVNGPAVPRPSSDPDTPGPRTSGDRDTCGPRTRSVGEDQITPVTSVRNLGVIFDSNLKMDMQITKACQIAYYHLHNIRRIRKFLSQEATCTIIHAFITSQIDYCNSLMNGLPENLIKNNKMIG